MFNQKHFVSKGNGHFKIMVHGNGPEKIIKEVNRRVASTERLIS